MKEKELKKLIQKYYDGESTEDEEMVLRDHFRQDCIPEGYEEEKVIFAFYKESGEVPEPSQEFEDRIMAEIDIFESRREPRKIRKYILPILSTAAGVLIMAGSYFFFLHKAEPRDTFTDPVLAYAETMKILRDISSQLNHGAKVLEPVSKINEVTLKTIEALNKKTILVEKSLKNLQNLQNANDILNETVKKNN